MVLAHTAPLNSATPARTTTMPRIEMDPSPGGDVELEHVFLTYDIELVLEQGDETGDGMPEADHDHHQRGKCGPTDRPATGFSFRHLILLIGLGRFSTTDIKAYSPDLGDCGHVEGVSIASD